MQIKVSKLFQWELEIWNARLPSKQGHSGQAKRAEAHENETYVLGTCALFALVPFRYPVSRKAKQVQSVARKPGETHADMLWLVHRHEFTIQSYEGCVHLQFFLYSIFAETCFGFPERYSTRQNHQYMPYHRLVETQTSIKWYYLS